MSKLSEIAARDHKAFAFNIEDAMDSRSDRRYLLGLLTEAVRVARNVRDSQESDLAVYSKWVGEQMTELLAKLGE